MKKNTLIAYIGPPEVFLKQILDKASFGLALYENINLLSENQQKRSQ